ncbi:MAG TPA: metallophosphoesterase [Allocoleopsis sp.]
MGKVQFSWQPILIIGMITVLLGVTQYFALRSIRPLFLKWKWALRILVVTAVATTFLIPYNVWLVRGLDVSEQGIASEFSHFWLGLIIYWIIIFSILYFSSRVLYVKKSFRSKIGKEGSRREFFQKVLGGTSLGLTGVVGVAGYGLAKADPAVENVQIKLSRFPKELDGYRIVQISDLHIGPIIQRQHVERVVDIVMKLQPDLIALTGDFVDGSLDQLADSVLPLSKLHCAGGVFFVSGNHDVFSGWETWSNKFRDLGITVLENEHVEIKVPAVNESFYLLGINDPTAVRLGMQSDVGIAIQGCDPNKAKILLAHQPRSVSQAAQYDIDLQLSGHTHAGQMWPFGLLVGFLQPYVKGLHRHSSRLQVYVNRGTGFWGPPMRIPYVPEITNIVIRSLE